METRTQTDALGAMELPADAPWGIHAARAVRNFPLPGNRVNPRLLRALLTTKKACALTNGELGFLAREKAEAIAEACDALAEEETGFDLLPALQGGAGTSTNLLVDELIARRTGLRAIEDVNLHQSTNDVYPTALRIAAVLAFRELAEATAQLQGIFQRLEKRFASVPIVGRTEWVEAVPLTLGAQFSVFSEAFARDRWRTFKCEERLRVVNLGGTAVGTGLTAPRDYVFLAVETLRELTGLGLARAENLVEATANADAFVEVSGMLKALACNLRKCGNDLRILQLQGLIRLPAVQAGSSIMPGKINPVILESVVQTAIKICANDGIVAECAGTGTLQINEYLPLLADALLESLDLSIASVGMLARHAEGIEADEIECRRRFDASTEIVTAFLPLIGYDRAGKLVETFRQTGGSDFRRFLEERLGRETVARVLAPENLMALGHRRTDLEPEGGPES